MSRSRFYLACALAALVFAAGIGDAAATPASYFVFTLTASGGFEPAFATHVELAGGLNSEGEVTSGTRRDEDAISVRMIDAAGAIVFRSVVGVPRVLRGEYHGGDGIIDGFVAQPFARSFVVRAPVIESGFVELSAPGARRPVRFDVATLLTRYRGVASLGTTGVGAAAPRAAALDGWSNGDPANRVDLLVLGDGFTASQEQAFSDAALDVVSGMFSIPPYSDYRNYVNATALFTASLEPGADQPYFDSNCTDYGFDQDCCTDTSAMSHSPREVNTAFDASYCTRNVQRLLTVNPSKIFTAASLVPDWDQLIVIVNATTYGGSGGGLSVLSMHPSAVEIAQHEYGHTFAALADEYTTAYPGYPPCSDGDNEMPRCERNVTDQTDRAVVKWSKWIDPLQSVPSSGAPPVATNAGLWQGARYLSSGMYRQGHLCIMRSLGAPFCDVAAEAYVLRLYEGGWGAPFGGVDVIEPGTESPAPGEVAVAPPGTTFAARVLGPIDGADLDVRWLVDDVEVSSSSATSGEIVTYVLETDPGFHTVQLRVSDVSDVLHPTSRPTLARTRTWNVEVEPVPTTTLPPSSTTTLPDTTTTGTTPTSTVTTTTASSTTTTLEVPTTTLPASTTTSLGDGSTTTTIGAQPLCARPVSGGDIPLATDCLFLLNAAVGLTSCVPECVCAPKGVLPVSATDALVCLTAAVGGDVDLHCPCGPLP